MHTAILNLVFAAAVGQHALANSPAHAPAPCENNPNATSGSCLCDWLGPMPQSCYGPRYGCYPGHNRYINRYPALHGHYYRQPYNYRHLFEYPWHAAPHEPAPYLGGEPVAVSGEVHEPLPVPQSISATPTAIVPTSDERVRTAVKPSGASPAKSRQARRSYQDKPLWSLID